MAVRRDLRVRTDESRYLELDQLALMCTERFDIVNHSCGDNKRRTGGGTRRRLNARTPDANVCTGRPLWRVAVHPPFISGSPYELGARHTGANLIGANKR